MDKIWGNIERIVSMEGTVEKFVYTKPGAVAESVLYRYPTYAERTVICCSTQSGCPVGCRFCGAGDAFVRSLTTEEIVSQPVQLLDLVEQETGTKAVDIEKLQIMFMSMGEPLLNQKRMVEAIHALHEKYPNASLLVSSSGPDVDYTPLMDCAVEVPAVGLQFSVHESTDAARDLLIPFKKKLTLEGIAERGREFYARTGRNPYFNYCIHEQNNSTEDVERLMKLFSPDVWFSTVSVICERDESLKAAHERQKSITDAFMQKMLEAGYNTRTFNPAGQSDGTAGGCGQLHHVQRWMKENPDLAKRSAGTGLPILHANDPGLLPIQSI